MRRLVWVLLLAACGDSGGTPVDAAADAAPDAMLSCDDHNTCTTDSVAAGACVHTPIPNCCGNGVVETGESCDDGNQADFDGCSSHCLYERAAVLNDVRILDGTMGCDLDGNGTVDNAFGGSANDAARGRLSQYFTQSLGGPGGCAVYVALFGFVGTDPALAGPFQFAFLSGVDTDVPAVPGDYFSGHEAFYVRSDGLDAAGQPLHSLAGMAPGGALSTMTGPMTLVFPFCEASVGNRVVTDLYETSLRGTVTSDATGITALSLRLCGAVAAASLHKYPNFSPFGGTTVLDVIVVGVNTLGTQITPTQPDVDVDMDGLETFADTDGDGNVDLCTDGNGTQITGRDCPLDPRIADAYSIAIDVGAVGATLAGRAP